MKKLKDLPVFSILAVVFFFVLGGVLGGMYVKIQYLEGKGGAPAAAPTAPTQPGAAAPTAPSVPTKVNITVSPSDPVKGDPNAKLTIVEFADYQCPFCEKMQTDIVPSIIKDYVDTGKAKFVFKNLAVLGKESVDAANAALCAKEQNKFWEYHDKLFAAQSG